jgi:hypothetical protein
MALSSEAGFAALRPEGQGLTYRESPPGQAGGEQDDLPGVGGHAERPERAPGPVDSGERRSQVLAGRFNRASESRDERCLHCLRGWSDTIYPNYGRVVIAHLFRLLRILSAHN